MNYKLGDSIMRYVVKSAITYHSSISQYETQIYIKGHSEILHQNFLMRFAHHLFPVNRKCKNMIFEMVCNSRFNAPNNYHHHIEAINGNAIPNAAKQKEVMTFLNMNVYSPTIYNEGIIMPVAKEAFKYYTFSLESTQIIDNVKLFKIRFMPKLWSQKLICGELYIIDKLWKINKMDINGRFSFAEFNLEMEFGTNFEDFMLPKKANLFLRYHVLGNAIATTYHTSFKYSNVDFIKKRIPLKREKKPLDLTAYYQLSSDTLPIVKDQDYWNSKRDQQLTEEEKQIYAKNSDVETSRIDTGNIKKYFTISQKITNTINLDYKGNKLKYSGLLNPFQLGYSARNGFTYRQQLRWSKSFANDEVIRVKPEIGYVFKRKELFFKFNTEWEYAPSRLGVISLDIGNGNQGYSSKIMKDINEHLKDSSFNFDNLNLKYFKHYYIELKNRIELFNGFQLHSGVSYHRRVPTKKSAIDTGDDVDHIINENYHDFIPFIGLSFTPRQYYWMDGRRKEYVYSYYPTISFEYARAIPDVWKSTGNYGRVEGDIHQSIYLGLSRHFNYHISGGFYTAQKSTYFADFRYFTRHNFPESWGDDDFGGIFHQLRSEWFYASDKYVQAFFMYESPFMLISRLKPNAMKHILSERFYLSQLWLPILPSYTEVGYGFGNHIFNIAVFAGFEKWKYNNIGVKFAFELFQ